MTAVRKLPQAEQDLIDLWVRIAADSPVNADRYLDHLDDKMRLLAKWPGMGRLHLQLADRLRAFPVDDYVIFYREADEGIDIVRVIHGARDLAALFPDPADKDTPQ